MTALSQQVLDALSPTKPIYAVLDGARDRRIGGWVSDTRAPAWCLWRGKLPAVVERVAPFLLRLERGREYTDRLFSVGWDSAWGILLAGDVPSRELRRHLRRFLRVRTEQGRIMTFRYYDPRVLRIFLPVLSGTEAAEFFGPIEAFAAAGESPDVFHVFRRNGSGVEDRAISSVAGVQGVA
jgi:hypothetical protein